MKIPSKTLWRGHDFYYDVLKCFEKLLDNQPKSVEQIFSMPLWFNRFLCTSFDEQLSCAGYNFVKDLFPGGKLMNVNVIRDQNLNLLEKHKLISITRCVPRHWLDCINKQHVNCTVIHPFQTINVNGSDKLLKNLDSNIIYNILISEKITIPVGMLNWCLELELSEIQIQTAFTFAHTCSSCIFDRVFQYKIATQILPTNDYLKRYRVKDSNVCEKCNLEFDSIEHSLYSCSEIVQILLKFFKFLKDECGITKNIGMVQYLLGFSGSENIGLNHILLEVTKSIFYSWESNLEVDAFIELVKHNIKKLMIKEKSIMIEKNKYESFNVK